MPGHEGRPERAIAENRKARYDYHIEDTVEAGLVLTGTEVKSLRLGRVNLRDSYAEIRSGEAWLVNVHISPYEQGNRFNHEPRRSRKLLLHKRELTRLTGQVTQRGFTLVPLRVYWSHGRAKVELALARGKREYDKRRDIAERESERALARALRGEKML